MSSMSGDGDALGAPGVAVEVAVACTVPEGLADALGLAVVVGDAVVSGVPLGLAVPVGVAVAVWAPVGAAVAVALVVAGVDVSLDDDVSDWTGVTIGRDGPDVSGLGDSLSVSVSVAAGAELESTGDGDVSSGDDASGDGEVPDASLGDGLVSSSPGPTATDWLGPRSVNATVRPVPRSKRATTNKGIAARDTRPPPLDVVRPRAG